VGSTFWTHGVDDVMHHETLLFYQLLTGFRVSS